MILRGLIAGAMLCAGQWASADPVTYTWDVDPAAAGAQDGSSTTAWSTGSAVKNWLNGGNNVIWTDSTPANPIIVQFGSGGIAATKTVTVSGTVNVAGIIFGAVGTSGGQPTAGYTLSGGKIVIADNGTISLGDGASTSSTFSTITSVLAGNNITLARTGTSAEQFLALGGANTWTGKLTIGDPASSAGGLFIRVSGAAALNTLDTVEIKSGNTLSLMGNNANYTSDFLVSGGGSGSGNAQRGAIRFDNNMTISGQVTLAANAVFNFQTSAPVASNVIFTEGIGESGGSFDFTKTGLGTLTLRGASTFTGATSIDTFGSGTNPGTLLLDFANSEVMDNLLYHGVDLGLLLLSGNGTRALAESTATLAVAGKDGVVNSQAFAVVSVDGPTAITATSGVGGSVNLSLGSIVRTGPGSTLTLKGPESGSITTVTNPGTLLGAWATYTTAGGAIGWAGSDGDGVLGIFKGEFEYGTGTDLAGYAAANNMIISSLSTGAVTQESTATVATISMTDTNFDRVITIGNLNRLNTSGVQLVTGAKNLTIGSSPNVGTISYVSDLGAELVLSNFDGTSVLTINSVIANGGGNMTVVLNGPGTTIFAGNNTYGGATIVASGILEVRAGSTLGSSGGGTNVGTGATLRLAGGVSINENISLGGNGVSGQGALRAVGGANTVDGAITLGGDALIVADAGSTLTLTRASDTTTGLSGSYDAQFGGGGTIVVTGRINSATVTKAGSGTLILSGNNIYTGATTITAGVVRVTNAAALGGTAAGTIVSAGAALEISSGTGIAIGAEGLTVSGTGIDNGGALRNVAGNNSYAGKITLAGATRINSDAGTLTIDVATAPAITSSSAQNLTFGGAGNIVVADAITTLGGSVTKDGTGTLTLSGANTYTGGTTILGGTLALGASDALANAGAVVVNGGTFSIGTFSDTVAGVTLNGGSITGTTGVLTGSAYNMQSGSVSAILGGTGALTKTTSGTVTLSGANTYTGVTNFRGGRLVLDYSGGATVLSTASTIWFGGGTLEFKGSGAPTAVSVGDITSASTQATGLSTIAVDANVAVTAASLVRASGTALLIDLSAAGSSMTFGTAPVVSTVNIATGITRGQITAGGGNAAIVMKDSTGRYDFAALDGDQRVIALNATNALPTTGGSTSTAYRILADGGVNSLEGTVNGSTLRIDTTAKGGTLDLAGSSLNLALFALLVDGSNDFTITNSGTTGTINQDTASAVFVYQFGTGKLTLDATIGAPQAFLMGTGLIDWTADVGVSSANFIYGATVRLSGTALTLGGSGTGLGSATLTIGNGGILELASGDFTRAIGTSANNVRFIADGGFSAYGGNRSVNLGGNDENPQTLTWGVGSFLGSGSKLILGSKYANAVVDLKNGLDLNGANQTVEVQSVNTAGVGGKISGSIVGTGASSLTKTGQGILTLAGTNSYSGSTFVNEGTLAITGSLSGNTSVNVAGGAELRLSGGGSVSAGTLALDNAAKLSLEVGTLAASTISLTGAATIAGSIALTLTLTSDPTDGNFFTLIDSAMLAGYEAGGRFYVNGVPINQGDTFFVSNGGFSQFFQIDYHGGSDHGDVVVQAVPEPSTAGVLLASTGLLLGLNRFRRRLP